MIVKWSDHDDATLRRLWNDGYTGGDIAKRLPGRTRCAVLGRLFRLGLSGTRYAHPSVLRSGRTQPRPKMVRGDGKTAAVVDLPLPPEPPQPPRMIAFADLEDGLCRYPFGTQAPYGFCGCTALAGQPYCGTHYVKTHTRHVRRPTDANVQRHDVNQRIAAARRALTEGVEG